MTQTHEEKALVSVIKKITETIEMIAEVVDDDDVRRYRGEWLRCKMYLAIIKRDLATDNELWADACKEIRTLEVFNE